jgi:predicted nucleotide-binding protein (sugar kinase/HSP70/actin superfamily)
MTTHSAVEAKMFPILRAKQHYNNPAIMKEEAELKETVYKFYNRLEELKLASTPLMKPTQRSSDKTKQIWNSARQEVKEAIINLTKNKTNVIPVAALPINLQSVPRDVQERVCKLSGLTLAPPVHNNNNNSDSSDSSA